MTERAPLPPSDSQQNAVFSPQPITSSRTLADQVTNALMKKILAGEFASSQLPSEQAMASGFGVSRTVIREAISRLKSEGLVQTRQGRGAFVSTDRFNVPYRIDLNADDVAGSLLHIIELRQGLDAEIAFLAAQRRKRDQMALIRRSLLDIDRASKAGQDAVAEDLNFHLTIANATGNPLFPELLGFLSRFLYAAVRVTRANEDRRKEFFDQVRVEHLAIADAIHLQNPEGAAMAAKTHMLNAAARIKSADSEFWSIELKRLAQKSESNKPTEKKKEGSEQQGKSGKSLVETNLLLA